MPRLRPWDEEADAAALLAAYLDGVVHRRDPGGGAEQRHDFDLQLRDGRTIAIEVTRHTVAEYLRTLAAVDARDWYFPSLSNNWVVDMSGPYNVRALHNQIAQPLTALEAAGFEQLLLRQALFDATLADDELDDDERSARAKLAAAGAWGAAESLYNMGVRSVCRIGAADESGGLIIPSDAPRAGATGASVVVDLVEYHAALADNAAKLARAAQADERHLFVWVESSQDQAVAAFGFPLLPERPPLLPDDIDAVWVVTAFDQAHIWQYHRDDGWRDLGVWSRPA
ncbi:MAG TPA: hypothetical protein VFA96_03930 [Nocardioides sp.]|nr:hypothetical protein [Nocardioides sp.]